MARVRFPDSVSYLVSKPRQRRLPGEAGEAPLEQIIAENFEVFENDIFVDGR